MKRKIVDMKKYLILIGGIIVRLSLLLFFSFSLQAQKNNTLSPGIYTLPDVMSIELSENGEFIEYAKMMSTDISYGQWQVQRHKLILDYYVLSSRGKSKYKQKDCGLGLGNDTISIFLYNSQKRPLHDDSLVIYFNENDKELGVVVPRAKANEYKVYEKILPDTFYIFHVYNYDVELKVSKSLHNGNCFYMYLTQIDDSFRKPLKIRLKSIRFRQFFNPFWKRGTRKRFVKYPIEEGTIRFTEDVKFDKME